MDDPGIDERQQPDEHERSPEEVERDCLLWLEKVHVWRTENRQTLKKIAHLQADILDDDARLGEWIYNLCLRGDIKHFETYERFLDEALLRAKTRQHATVAALNKLRARLEEIADAAIMVPSVTQTPEFDDRVDEASWESFPASDPPGYNPGRA